MRRLVVVLSLLATWLFFFEYLPPRKTVHFFGDIEGYHYPLYDHAKRAFYEGRFPEWDSGIYSGISYAGNPQAGLFYPPNWVLYAFNWHRIGVRFWSIEALQIAHYWIAFILAWLWLREALRTETAALLGAAAFAFGGYRVAEVQHLGALLGYAWYPLALWGIFAAQRDGDWRQLWKTAAGSAMCFLAGYPPMWFVLNVCCGVYALALGGWRLGLRAIGALVFALLIVMVQLAPILEAAGLKISDPQYGGSGLPGGPFLLLQYFLPNYYNHAREVPLFDSPAETYFYLGAQALLGVAYLAVRRNWMSVVPAAAILGASFLFLYDPGHLVGSIVRLIPHVEEVCHDWNFLAAISLGIVMLAAAGIDEIGPGTNRRLAWMAVTAAILWSARQWVVWHRGGRFATGWWTLAEVAVTMLILYALLRAPRKGIVMGAILLTVWMEFKVYGTSRRFNASPGSMDVQMAKDVRTGGPEFVGVKDSVYRELLRNVEYRMVSDGGPLATEYRYIGLSTPVGFDPFLPKQYKELVEHFTPFSTNREFPFDWTNAEMMDAFGVRYVITWHGVPARQKLLDDSRFRAIEPGDSFYSIFEYIAARPAYRFDSGVAKRITWTPEHRMFQVKSDEGGAFHLLEQYFPGWRAYVDDKQVPVERVRTAFQGIQVPAGAHKVEFEYRSTALRIGAVISLLALIATFRTALMKRKPGCLSDSRVAASPRATGA